MALSAVNSLNNFTCVIKCLIKCRNRICTPYTIQQENLKEEKLINLRNSSILSSLNKYVPLKLVIFLLCHVRE